MKKGHRKVMNVEKFCLQSNCIYWMTIDICGHHEHDMDEKSDFLNLSFKISCPACYCMIFVLILYNHGCRSIPVDQIGCFGSATNIQTIGKSN